MTLFSEKFTLFTAMILVTGITFAAEHDHAHEHEHEHEHRENTDHREHASHVHGEGQLTLVIEGKTIAITLTTPAESIFGFEHAPTTEPEKSQLNKALATLNAPTTLFNFGKEAQCKTTTHTVHSPFDNSDQPKASTASHTDIDAEYNFECAQPANVKKVDLLLIKQFPGLRTLKVDYVTESVQGSQTLSAPATEITLR
jgi:hypothetical protein